MTNTDGIEHIGTVRKAQEAFAYITKRTENAMYLCDAVKRITQEFSEFVEHFKKRRRFFRQFYR